MELPAYDGAKLCVPPSLRRRLTASASRCTVEQIQTKLHNADLRRQKFYANLSSKARRKQRRIVDEDNLAQRLDAKLLAAQQKRLQILRSRSEMRTALNEKASRSLLRSIALQSKYNQKRAAAESNNSELLEAQKKKLKDEFLHVGKVAKSVSQQETEKLQSAKRQIADCPIESVNWNKKTQKQADHLSRKLLRCWREFCKQGTTLKLAKSYYILNINANDVKSMPFEHFAFLIDTPSTLQSTKALLDRLETRYRIIMEVASGTTLDNINHLLTRVVTPNSRHMEKVESYRTTTKKSATLSRYQARVVLSAYMILGHPDAVFRCQGVRETALAKSAKMFIQEYEILIEIILNGSSKTSSDESDPGRNCTFRSQIAAFDEAWCSYLNSFVVWKVKDVESLEEDLVRAACQMEISMMRKYKPAPERDDGVLTHDVKAFQKQMKVTEHQKLLREKIMHLSGKAGLEHLQNTLSDTRKKFLKSKENRTSVKSPVSHIPSPHLTTSSSIASPDEKNDSVVSSPLEEDTNMPQLKDPDSVSSSLGLVDPPGEIMSMTNVLIVNEFLHGRHYSATDSLYLSDETQKVRETMEKAFWDVIFNSIQEDKYDQIVVLMEEVRDELCEMSPKSRKQEILEAIDLDILSQLLNSHRLDIEYLGRIMEFALASLQKLSAVAYENQLKESHQKVMSELAELCHAGDGSTRSHAIALIKGLRFLLEQIQALKQEISKARIKILEPLLKGPTGLEYLGKAFTKLYGPPSDALIRLPLTIQWLSSVAPGKDREWSEHRGVLLELHDSSSERLVLPTTVLRTGGQFSRTLQTSPNVFISDITGADNGYRECKGEKGDLLVRLGLLKLVNNVDGVTQEDLPETLKLNYIRLRFVQNELQKITVIATSILVLRQTLVMEQMISNYEDMESTIVACSVQLSQILDTVIDAGLEELVEVLCKITDKFNTTNDSTKTHSRKHLLTRMLRKSVQAGDPVFVKVSRAVYMATRGVVLGGSGKHGKELAEKALRQVGSAVLTEKLVETAGVLGVVARVSENVHGPWYVRLTENVL
ncbi:uncharacterized protein [Rutidosis leptorrhynchoides]|uniref:uncharacterized protein n=1 Tax=Rutidosis leptorrhynchoides TaxID=125765 RepID=UPI003A996645